MIAGMNITDMGPTFDADVGIHSPGVETAEIPPRVASFLLHTIEKRFWSYSEWQHMWPGAFAGTCSPAPETAEKAANRSREMWEVSCLAETVANVIPGLHALRRKAYWMDWPINQLHFRFHAKCDFQAPPIRTSARRVLGGLQGP